MIKRFNRYLVDLFFPQVCPFCERIMDYKKGLVCTSCIQVLPFIETRCGKCGKSISEQDEICDDCRKTKHAFEEGRAVFKYEGTIAQSLLNYKYNGRRSYGTVYAMWIEKCLGDWIRSVNPDVIIPVPIHKKRLRERTYNQAEIIGKELAKRLALPFDANYVYRKKNTSPQKKLSALERMRNMQDAFVIKDSNLKNKTILIVDDIYTTGLTMDAMAGVLMNAGAKKVFFVTVSAGVF